MNMNTGRWFKAMLLAVLVVSILFPLLFYFKYFHHGISDRADSWSAFAAFWGTFISLGNAAFLIFLTYIFQSQERQRNKISDRPVIGLSWNGWRYDMINVGKGSALNIITYTASATDMKAGKFTNQFHCYSFQPNGVFKDTWLSGVVILIQYNDIFNATYYSMMQGNQLYVFDERGEFLVKSVQDNSDEVLTNFKRYLKFDRIEPSMPSVSR
jgi:hypothetical protein